MIFRCRKYNYYIVLSGTEMRRCRRLDFSFTFWSRINSFFFPSFSRHKANDDIIYVNFPFKIMRSFRLMFLRCCHLWNIQMQSKFGFVMDLVLFIFLEFFECAHDSHSAQQFFSSHSVCARHSRSNALTLICVSNGNSVKRNQH